MSALRCIALALALACGGLAQAQVGPTPAEAARYQGLHAAAHAGDAARITQLAAAGADLNARDGNGRTPLHVATFARQRSAIEALVKAGAKLDLLEHDRYDAVTIASVADDEATLRLLLALGASAKQVTTATTAPRSSPPPTWGMTAWCGNSLPPARRWTT